VLSTRDHDALEGHRAEENRANLTGRINAWKPILNALTIHYGDRITAAN
jgi:hypothetical protein